MAYLDTATGLEGCNVLLIGVEDLFFSGRVAGLGDDEQAERRDENARKLYMAMTRAGQRLVVVSAQRLPHEMEALFELPSAEGCTGARGEGSGDRHSVWP
jgi:superfamily I DNA/RNA helicase